MSNEQDSKAKDSEKTVDELASAQAAPPPEMESEFKVTVRKLEMPVRPRGVLAE